MHLRASDGSAFRLAILGYEFPETEHDLHDANWLRIHIDVACPRGRWEATSPCLLTWEVTRLANWLEAADAGEAVDPEAGFTEPNLLFRLVGERPGSRNLRLYFELEFRPEGSPSSECPQEDLWVEFPLREVNLRAGAAALRSQLARFPERT